MVINMKKHSFSLLIIVFFTYHAPDSYTMSANQLPNTPVNFTINLPAITQQQFSQPTTTLIGHEGTTEITNAPRNANVNTNDISLKNNISIATTIALCQQLFTALQHQKMNFLEMLKTHPLSFSLASFVLLYVAFYAYIWSENHYLANQNLWCYWPKNSCISHECLIKAIQTKYINSDNPTDHLSPLMLFMRDIAYEEQRITRYIWYTQCIQKTPIARILPCTNTLTEKAKELLSSLTVLKKIFNDWLSTYNSAQLYQKTFMTQI